MPPLLPIPYTPLRTQQQASPVCLATCKGNMVLIVQCLDAYGAVL
jgi:hypothetical protein